MQRKRTLNFRACSLSSSSATIVRCVAAIFGLAAMRAVATVQIDYAGGQDTVFVYS